MDGHGSSSSGFMGTYIALNQGSDPASEGVTLAKIFRNPPN